MKKIAIIFSLILIVLANVSAQTVALNRNGNTQIFKSINAFIEANNVAEDGDTLYLSGHNFNSPVNFTKSLKIYGVGHLEAATTATGKTYIGNINLKEGADNFHIEGIDFADLSVEYNKSVKNLVVKRCNVRGTISFTGTENPTENFLITGSTIISINLDNIIDALISNNIINGQILNSKENIIRNNIFFSGFNAYTLVGSNNNMILNNYFARTSSNPYNICSGDGNIFYNNAFLHNSPNLGTNAISENNWTSVNMQDFFISKEGNSYNPEDDLHLTEPENYIGEDNTEIGIYGGIYPYKINAIPIIPYIETTIIPHHVDEDGNLPVQIKVKAQNEQD